jgi:A/G-specific adenine glycosylase
VREVFHAVALASDARGRVLVQKRPERGLWAGMWQPAGLDGESRPVTPTDLRKAIGAESVELAGALTHVTSHRLVRLGVFVAVAAEARGGRRWAARDELAGLAMPAPHRRIVRALVRS